MHHLCIYSKQNLHSMQMLCLKMTEVLLRIQQVAKRERWIYLIHRLKGEERSVTPFQGAEHLQ